jgi:uncharacterized protein DUF262
MLEVKPISRERTLLQWFKEQDKIDLDPSYQRRGDLWPPKHRKLLINSILNSYDIPKIYLADFTYISSPLNENRKPYAVIDGKQRLSIFFDFLNDGIALDETPIHFEGQELKLGGLRYSDLKLKHSKLVKRFEEFTPTVMSVITDKLEEVQELFIRLNLNVSISGAERRNAMPGPIPALIRTLSVHEFFRSYASFPINRLQDLDAAAKILNMELQKGFVSTNKVDLDRFVMTNKDKDESDFKGIYKSAVQSLNKMKRVFIKKDSLLKGQAQLTVYYQLVKVYGEQYGDLLREFLLQFERDRAKVREQAAARGRGERVKISDATLLDYNTFVRSPDNKSKQEYMFNVLEDRLGQYVKTSSGSY